MARPDVYRLALLADGGFPVAQRYSHPVKDWQQAAAWRERWFTSPLPFVTDGIVIRTQREPAGDGWLPGQGVLGGGLEISASFTSGGSEHNPVCHRA